MVIIDIHTKRQVVKIQFLKNVIKKRKKKRLNPVGKTTAPSNGKSDLFSWG